MERKTVRSSLANALAESPLTILQALTDKILEVTRAGSAGLSLLTKDDGGKSFYWPAISGMWKVYIGGGTPRDFGPCGDVLDFNTPLLFKRPERRYTYFLPVTPPVEEALLVPFYAGGELSAPSGRSLTMTVIISMRRINVNLSASAGLPHPPIRWRRWPPA